MADEKRKRGRPKGSKTKSPNASKTGPKTSKGKYRKALKDSLTKSPKIIKLKTPDELDEDEQIAELFKNSRLRRFQALFREMENGKGISAIQAAAAIEKIEYDIKEEDADQQIEIVWTVIPTDKAEEIA